MLCNPASSLTLVIFFSRLVWVVGFVFFFLEFSHFCENNISADMLRSAGRKETVLPFKWWRGKAKWLFPVQAFSGKGSCFLLVGFCGCFFPPSIKTDTISYLWKARFSYFTRQWQTIPGNLTSYCCMWLPIGTCENKRMATEMDSQHCLLPSFWSKKEEYCTEVKVNQERLIVQPQWKGAVGTRKAEYAQ